MSKPPPAPESTPAAAPEPARKLPADVTDLGRLFLELVESQMARPSITEILDKGGKLYVGPGGVGRLVSRADFLDALAEFCTRAGVSPGALSDGRAERLDRDRHQALIDRNRARQVAILKKDPHK